MKLRYNKLVKGIEYRHLCSGMCFGCVGKFNGSFFVPKSKCLREDYKEYVNETDRCNSHTGDSCFYELVAEEITGVLEIGDTI